MNTIAGFSSRSTLSTITQLPQRDEAAMPDLQPGFSNSSSPSDEPDEAPAVNAKVLENDSVEDKAITSPENKRRTRK